MSIELRYQDRLRMRLGLPIYPRVSWAPDLRLRHEPWDLRYGLPSHPWLWKHKDWPHWQRLPVDPYRVHTFDEIETKLRDEVISKWGVGFYRSLHRAGKKERDRPT